MQDAQSPRQQSSCPADPKSSFACHTNGHGRAHPHITAGLAHQQQQQHVAPLQYPAIHPNAICMKAENLWETYQAAGGSKHACKKEFEYVHSASCSLVEIIFVIVSGPQSEQLELASIRSAQGCMSAEMPLICFEHFKAFSPIGRAKSNPFGNFPRVVIDVDPYQSKFVEKDIPSDESLQQGLNRSGELNFCPYEPSCLPRAWHALLLLFKKKFEISTTLLLGFCLIKSAVFTLIKVLMGPLEMHTRL